MDILHREQYDVTQDTSLTSKDKTTVIAAGLTVTKPNSTSSQAKGASTVRNPPYNDE